MKKAHLFLIIISALLFSNVTFATSVKYSNSAVIHDKKQLNIDEVAYFVSVNFHAVLIDAKQIEGTEDLLVTCEGGQIIYLEIKDGVIISGNEMPNQ
jgi:hypothetical protein